TGTTAAKEAKPWTLSKANNAPLAKEAAPSDPLGNQLVTLDAPAPELFAAPPGDPTRPMPPGSNWNKKQDLDLQAARAEVQKLSAALQEATQRLKNLEKTRAETAKRDGKNAYGEALASGQAYVKAAPGGGSYVMTDPQGRVTV